MQNMKQQQKHSLITENMNTRRDKKNISNFLLAWKPNLINNLKKKLKKKQIER